MCEKTQKRKGNVSKHWKPRKKETRKKNRKRDRERWREREREREREPLNKT